MVSRTGQNGGGANSRPNLVASDWVAAAREMLIEGGIAAVQVNPLAGRLGVTRGGFYWRFRDRQDLLDRLLDDWSARNTKSILSALEDSGTPKDRYRRLVSLWIDEQDFDPALDAAIRQWGTVSDDVAVKVRRADEIRIAAIADVFETAGQDPTVAMVRARVVYYHQVGYYALGIRETLDRRRELMPIYDKILSGLGG